MFSLHILVKAYGILKSGQMTFVFELVDLLCQTIAPEHREVSS